MSVDVYVSAAYDDPNRSYPVASLWINGSLFDQYPCGLTRKRVKWLPLWLPFNARYDFGIYAQLACVKQLREFGERMATALHEAAA